MLYAQASGMNTAQLEAEQEAAAALRGLWRDLEELTEQTDGDLHATKAAFAKTTEEQVCTSSVSTATLSDCVAVRVPVWSGWYPLHVPYLALTALLCYGCRWLSSKHPRLLSLHAC